MVMFTHKFVYVLCRSSDALLHNTKYLKRNELLAQVAKRAERAQLLVIVHYDCVLKGGCYG